MVHRIAARLALLMVLVGPAPLGLWPTVAPHNQPRRAAPTAGSANALASLCVEAAAIGVEDAGRVPAQMGSAIAMALWNRLAAQVTGACAKCSRRQTSRFCRTNGRRVAGVNKAAAGTRGADALCTACALHATRKGSHCEGEWGWIC